MPNENNDADVAAHFFEGPGWDDHEEDEPQPEMADDRDDEDDVEGHASGMG
jgi:hypothetical protein